MKLFIFFCFQLLCVNVEAQHPFMLEMDVAPALDGKKIYLRMYDNYSQNKFNVIDSFVLSGRRIQYSGELHKPTEQAEFFTKDKSDYYVSFYIDSGLNKFTLLEPDKHLYKRFRLRFHHSISNNLKDSLEAIWNKKHFATEKLEGDKKLAAARNFNRQMLQVLKKYPVVFASLIELYSYTYLSLGFQPADLLEVFESFDSSITATPLGIELGYRLKRMMSTGVGLPMPEISAVTSAGHQFTNRSLSGTVYMVAFGAPWCVPCRENLNSLKEIYQGAKDKGFKILMLNLDDDEQAWKKEITTIGQDWIFLNEHKKFAESDWASGFGISAIPQYLIVDEQGIIRYNYLNSGAKFDTKYVAALITRLLDRR